MFRATLAGLADEYESLEAQNEDLSIEILRLRSSIDDVVQKELARMSSSMPARVSNLSQDFDDIVLNEKNCEDSQKVKASTLSKISITFSDDALSSLPDNADYEVGECASDVPSEYAQRPKLRKSLSASSLNRVSLPGVARQSAQVQLSQWLDPKYEGVCPSDELDIWSRGFHLPYSECVVIDPFGEVKLTWDAFVLASILINSFIIPFDLFFLARSTSPDILDVITHSLTIIFTIDMVLQFFTGYVDNETMTKNMDRIMIAKRYWQFWLWIDLIAISPWDLLYSTSNTGLRSLKLLRTVRLIRMIRPITSFARHHIWVDIFNHTLWVVCFFLGLHIHGIIWALLQLESASVETVSQAFELYSKSFAWALRGFTTGASTDRTDDLRFLILESAIGAERLLLFLFVSKHLICNWLPMVLQKSQNVASSRVLEYLRARNVSFDTQRKVLLGLRESKHAKQRGESVAAIEQLSHVLPAKLQHQIQIEMWSARLLSLKLLECVASWAAGFSENLARLASEVVHPSHTVLFKEGSAASAAYHILGGEMRLTRSSAEHRPLEKFVNGMWVGENSFLSAALRYPASCVTCTLSSLMEVRGKDFQRMVSKFGLTHCFQEFCSEQLWRGICGRCGSLGEDSSTKGTRGISRSITQRLPSQRQPSLDWSEKNSQYSLGGLAADLWQFLEAHNLMLLLPVLHQHFSNVKNLQAFEELVRNDIEELCSHYPSSSASTIRNALRSDSFQDFANARSQRLRETLFHEVSSLQHLIFLSHYKLEAGTEAALIRTELEQAMRLDPGSLGHCFEEPVFLDSDSLQSLDHLRERVDNTHNLVILLTENVLLRPWVLVEIITARRRRTQIIPVSISRVGSQFTFPDESWFDRFRSGELLNEEAMDLLLKYDCTLWEVADAIEATFQQIALPYSPHKSKSIRRAEIEAILRRCKLRSGEDAATKLPRMSTSARMSVKRDSAIRQLWDGICSDTLPLTRQGTGASAMFG